MYDYNQMARIYWWTVAVIGYALLAHAAFVVATLPPTVILQIAMCCVFVCVISIFPVRISGTTLSVAYGEIFIFLTLFLFGVEAAAIAAAIEGAIGSRRTSKRWSSWFGSPAMSAITISISGFAFVALRTALDRQGLLTGPAMVVLIIMSALVYSVLCNLLPSLLLAIKNDERLEVLAMLADRSWMAFVYFGCAALAANLYYAAVLVDFWILPAVMPAVILLLWALRRIPVRAENARRERAHHA